MKFICLHSLVLIIFVLFMFILFKVLGEQFIWKKEYEIHIFPSDDKKFSLHTHFH